MNIYDEGFRAYGLGIDENPYPLLSNQWYEWDQGWEDAEDEELTVQEDEDDANA